MAELLKVDEWKGASGHWFVGDVHTWTGWQVMAEILDVDFDGLLELLQNKYHATIVESSVPIFFFENYKDAHQFKLDVNRIERHKQIMVEKQF